MRLLLTANSAWNILNFRRGLVSALLGEGHSLHVLAPDDDAAAGLPALGCDFTPLVMDKKGLNPLNELQLVRRFREHFRRIRPDAVLSFTIKNNIYGALAVRGTGLPFIPNVTGLGTAFLSGTLLQGVAEQLYRWSFRPLQTVFFQNDEDRALFLERGLVRPEQARLVPGSGIDLHHFAAQPFPPADTPPVFLMIARLLRDKGVLEYVAAARRVRRKHPDVRFQLLGPLGAENRTAITADVVRAWQEEGVLEYLGTREDVRPVIAAASCVVLPSYREGAPRTLIEAAAMGRPVIASDVPGCRAVVDAEVTGLFCAARSDESLAEACERFLALSHQQQRDMGLAGRARMEQAYDQRLVVEAYRQVLRQIQGGDAPARLAG